MVPIRLSDEEFEGISKKAEIAEVTVPYYIRYLALRSMPPLVSKDTWKMVISTIQEVDNTLGYMSYDYVTKKKRHIDEIEKVAEKLNSLLELLVPLVDKAGSKNK